MTRTDSPIVAQETAFQRFRDLPPVGPHELVGLWGGGVSRLAIP